MSITIHFLRHAEAAHNIAAREKGDAAYNDPAYTDAPLTDTGFEQAFNTSIDVDLFSAIYCSPLKRCRQTLHSVMIGPNTFADERIALDDRLMEPQGHICNKRAERDVLVGEVPIWNTGLVAATNPYTGAESTNDFKRRIIAFTDDLIASGHITVLIISHHEWIRMWFAIYKQMHVSPANAQVLVATI